MFQYRRLSCPCQSTFRRHRSPGPGRRPPVRALAVHEALGARRRVRTREVFSMRRSSGCRGVSACLLLATLVLPRSATAGGVGVSDPPDRVGLPPDSTLHTSAYEINAIPFHLYKARIDRAPHANRDYDFLWSDTYKSRLHTPLDTLTGPEQINDIQRLAEAAAEIQSNPLGLPWTKLELTYNFLAARDTIRDSVYNASTQAPIGFSVAQLTYVAAERKHIDAYLYGRAFDAHGQWGTYLGDGSGDTTRISNYGQFPSNYVSSAEDSLTGHAGSPLTNNSIQVPGPLPSQVGSAAANRWTRPNGTATGIVQHEGLHCINNDRAGFLHMFASGAEVLTGVSSDPPRYDVDYHYSLSPTWQNASNAYPHWQSFMAYLAFNWRGADTTASAWADDLLRRWATKPTSQRFLTGLALRLRDSECAECSTYPGFSELDSLARVQRLIHDWRVADYVNSSTLPGGKYGFPPQFGFSPADQLGSWQNIDQVASDDGYAVPPVITIGPSSAARSQWFTQRPAGPGFSARPLKLSMFGAEYFVFRADPVLGSNPQKLIVRVQPSLLLKRTIRTYPGCSPAPPFDESGRLFASVVSYSQAADSLFRHPDWAASVVTQSASLDSVRGDLTFEIADFGTTTRAVLLVVTLEDGPSGYYSAAETYANVSDSVQIGVGATLTDGTTPVAARGVATSSQVETEAAWSPDGARLAYRKVDASGNSRIFLRAAEGTGSETPLRSASAGQFQPSWSPRTNTIAYVESTETTGGRIYLVDVPTGAAQLLTGSRKYCHEPVFSPNGGWLAYLRDWRVDSGEDQDPPRDGTSNQPVLSYGWDVRIHELSTGVDSLLARFSQPAEVGAGELRGLRWSPDGRFVTFSKWDHNANQYHLYQVDVPTRSLTTHDSQAPAARTRELSPGSGPLLTEEVSGHPYATHCSPEAYGLCQCEPYDGVASATADWMALRDTVQATSSSVAYRTGARFTLPHWSPDGTRIAYTTTQNGSPDV